MLKFILLGIIIGIFIDMIVEIWWSSTPCFYSTVSFEEGEHINIVHFICTEKTTQEAIETYQSFIEYLQNDNSRKITVLVPLKRMPLRTETLVEITHDFNINSKEVHTII